MSKVYVIASMTPKGAVLYAATADKSLAESVYKTLKKQYRGTELENALEILKFSDEQAIALASGQYEQTDPATKRKILVEDYPRNLLLALADLSLYSKNIPTDAVTTDVEEGISYCLSMLPKQEADVLRLRYMERMSLREIGDALDLSAERIRVIEQHALSALLAPSYLDYIRYGRAGHAQLACRKPQDAGEFDAKTPLEELGLSARSLNSLKKKGYDLVSDLLILKEKDIAAIRNLGKQSMIEVAQALERIGATDSAWSKYLPLPSRQIS
ncbi:MAG: hypothetical protein J6V39_05760 [Clostridia bacterium]|nr:hypothetical protein [Clostridia bacterium]